MGPVSPQGSWKSLNHVPPNSHVEILSPRISAQDLIWKQSDWRCNLLRWGHTWVQCPPIAVWLCCLVTKCVWLFATPWTAAHQVPLPSTISRSLLKLMSIELVMLSAHLILWYPYKWEKSGHKQREKVMGSWRQRSESCSCKARNAKDCQQTIQSQVRHLEQILSHSSQEKPTNILTLEFWRWWK